MENEDIIHEEIPDIPESQRSIIYYAHMENLNNISLIPFLDLHFPPEATLLRLLNDYINEESTLSVNDFNKLMKYKKKFNCPICFEEDKNDGIILSCEHVFCYNCLKHWLIEKSNSCPLCRENV